MAKKIKKEPITVSPIEVRCRRVFDKKYNTIMIDTFVCLFDKDMVVMPNAYKNIADLSDRIFKLDEITVNMILDRLNYEDITFDSDGNRIQNNYIIEVSAKYFESIDNLSKMLNLLATFPESKERIVLLINSNMLKELTEAGKYAYRAFKDAGYKIILDAIGDDYLNLDILTKFSADYFRIDSSYFSDFSTNVKIKAMLKMLVGFAKETKTQIIADNINNIVLFGFLKDLGVHYFIPTLNNRAYRLNDDKMANLKEENNQSAKK